MHNDEFAIAQAALLERHDLDCEERWLEAPSIHGSAHVLVTGDGPPVVLLNGIGVPAAMLAPLMSRLDGVTQYAVDLPGYGLTDTTSEFADDLRVNAVRFLTEMLDALGLDRPVIVANSLGSLWATWLAIDRPDRVAALIHVGCPALALDTSAPLPMRLLSVRPLGRLMLRLQQPSEGQVEQLAKMVHEHPLPDDIARLVLATERLDHFESAFRSMLHRLLRLRGARPNVSLTSTELATVQAPSLLVFARDDPMGGPAVGERMVETMPDARLHVVDGGHAPWVHHADQIAPAIVRFLDQISWAR